MYISWCLHKGFKCLSNEGKVFITKYVTFNEQRYHFPLFFSIDYGYELYTLPKSLPCNLSSTYRNITKCKVITYLTYPACLICHFPYIGYMYITIEFDSQKNGVLKSTPWLLGLVPRKSIKS